MSKFNDLYDKILDYNDQLFYIEEKKTKSEYRLQKFKNEHNYDKKDGTVEMNGERVKFKTGGSNKHNAEIRGNIEIPGKILKSCGMKNELYMNKAAFNTKHPKTHEFIFRHEEGHMIDKNAREKSRDSKIKRDNKRTSFHNKYMDSVLDSLKEGKISKEEAVAKIDKLNKMSDKKSQSTYDELKKDIEKFISDSHVTSQHGKGYDEYIADTYAVTKTGTKPAKKFFDHAEKHE